MSNALSQIRGALAQVRKWSAAWSTPECELKRRNQKMEIRVVSPVGKGQSVGYRRTTAAPLYSRLVTRKAAKHRPKDGMAGAA
jgi:hypothetical protein